MYERITITDEKAGLIYLVRKLPVAACQTMPLSLSHRSLTVHFLLYTA
jgi:hypothetical protein